MPNLTKKGGKNVQKSIDNNSVRVKMYKNLLIIIRPLLYYVYRLWI